MKSFSFRLDRILKLREGAEQRQARRLGQAVEAESMLARLCEVQESHLRAVGDQLLRAPGERLSAGMLRILRLASTAAANQLEDTERSRLEAEQAADSERERLAEARVERRSLEKLKEHQRTAWQEESGREEQKAMDEIAGRTKRDGSAA